MVELEWQHFNTHPNTIFQIQIIAQRNHNRWSVLGSTHNAPLLPYWDKTMVVEDGLVLRLQLWDHNLP
ncbi:hypothetical protein [Gillisia sp. Hel_I_86]|uniref:hypothetical protein n=1 Tax=Gillisia sp. Hel_I_86 TaxID=1249981 RepID=UPI00119CF2A9|nr:hypothetical protein [Gillisia sp. Hel_I_86]